MESKKLGEHIAKLRRERHMTQTELADRLYITEKAVSKWECGNGFPDLDNIGKLAAFFDISIDELLQAKEKDKSETVSEEQILQLQEGNSPLINCYEDIVVYSSYMNSPLEALPVSQRKNCGRYRFIPFIRSNKQRQLPSLV